MLSQSRCWRAVESKGCVVLEILKASLPPDLADQKELRIEVPLDKWTLVVKNALSDRKLLGGVLLDFAIPKEPLSEAIGSDRLVAELRRIVIEATAALVEVESLVLEPRRGREE